MEEDLVQLLQQFDACDREASALVSGLTEAQSAWRSEPGSWSVAECLDHLAITNRVYLDAMRQPAQAANERNRLRRGPALPGFVGRWFVRSLEPPVKPAFKIKARKFVQPKPLLPLNDAVAAFNDSQHQIRDFIREFENIDLASISFPNPFIPGVRFSLATGLHVLAAHERRHLWQAAVTRQAALAQPN